MAAPIDAEFWRLQAEMMERISTRLSEVLADEEGKLSERSVAVLSKLARDAGQMAAVADKSIDAEDEGEGP